MLFQTNFYFVARVPLKKYSGLINLIKDTVNSHSPGMFSNSNDASSALNNFQRRVHDIINAQKRAEKKNQQENNNVFHLTIATFCVCVRR
jgi:hypothetical protein